MRIFKVNKVHTFLVGMMMMAFLLCCSSQVQAAQEGDYTYTVTDGKAEITKYTGAGGTVAIPSTLGELPVTSIGDYAFFNCIGLTSINIPQGVTSIGDWAFSSCDSLRNISIPQGVTSISANVFANCTDLKTITINSATTRIYDDAGTIPAATKIIGYAKSYAKDYATKYNRPFEVIGETNTLQSIAVTIPATKLSYTVGDKLDITGLVVTGTYSDGSTQAESISAANISGFNSAVATTDQVLTITASNKTVTYKVQIVAAQDTTGMTEIETSSPVVVPSKIWTIKLNGLVNEASLNGKIYVTNSKGIKQQITCTTTVVNGLSQIEVKPDKNYVPDNYILWIKNIKSIKEIGIKKQVFMKFMVK